MNEKLLLEAIEQLTRMQRVQVELAIAKARATVKEGFTTRGQKATQFPNGNYGIVVQSQSSNLQTINCVIARAGSANSILTLGDMKIYNMATGLTILSPVRIPLQPNDLRTLENSTQTDLDLWLFGEENPLVAFSTL